ncbi:MAG: universal stress protein [Acidobacteriota bacterium]
MSSVDAPSPVPTPFTPSTVIYATDFFPPAENAGRFASLLARQFNAELLVVHTFVLTQAAMEAEAKTGAAVKSNQRQECEAALAKIARHYGEGTRTASTLLEGDPQEQLPRLEREHAPAILVMGTEGRGRLERPLLGSVAKKVLRSAVGPALTVGPQVPSAPGDTVQIRRILFATTLAPGAGRGAACALAMIQAFHAEMDVLHVVRPELASNADELEQAQQRFQESVEPLSYEHAHRVSSPRGVLTIGDHAPAHILDHVRENSIDLLVLSLSWRSHLWAESLVSVAFQVIAHAPCPVLTILG